MPRDCRDDNGTITYLGTRPAYDQGNTFGEQVLLIQHLLAIFGEWLLIVWRDAFGFTVCSFACICHGSEYLNGLNLYHTI